LYDILESRNLKVCLVNARHMKNVPGRRTDWHECQWLQYLHSVGLLRGAFRPEAEVTAVRTIMRHRTELVQMSSQHVLHMHKALTQMNLQIHHVIDDITGLTGLAIVDAILAGQRDPVELAKLRNWRIKADPETIRKSLVGNWRDEHLFTLRQSRELYRTYQQQMVKCDQEIEKLVGGLEPRVDPEEKPLPPDRKRYRGAKKRAKKNGQPDTGFNLRTEAYKLFGVDVTQIPGLETMALPLFGEVGRDMSNWPTADHFASWQGAVPGQRHQRRSGTVEGHTESPQPCWTNVPASRLFSASQSHPDGRLPPPDEDQTGARRSDHCDRPQDRSDLLHHGEKPSGV
jgi:hypothetical protein